jgi:hypothetical protein
MISGVLSTLVAFAFSYCRQRIYPAWPARIFVADVGDILPVLQLRPLKRDGRLYRVTKDGELKLAASGFVNPPGVCFIGHHLRVTDINGEFTAGMRELPRGFLVRIDRQ